MKMFPTDLTHFPKEKMMAKKKSPPHSLSRATEREIQRVERDPRLRTIAALFAALRQAAPDAFDETKPADNPQICLDRGQRISLLARRAQLGLSLFRAEDVVQLPPESRR
jgi:hypothetical protein